MRLVLPSAASPLCYTEHPAREVRMERCIHEGVDPNIILAKIPQ
ncbi:MAG TPA: hypothetical protein VHZ51_02410 [Ktedonobacteraceae bacterium]|nr:hypothetical protein [Ktedonobacteraceae bacterium]